MPLGTVVKDVLAKQPPAPVADVKAKEEALMKAMEPVAQEMYASAQQSGAGTPPPGSQGGSSSEAGKAAKGDDQGGKKGGDDVVDADFTMK